MTEISILLYAGILLVAGLCSAAYLVFFFSKRPDVRRIARGLFLASACLQTIYLLLRYILAGYTPITSPFETIFFFSWSVTLAYCLFRWRYPVKNFGTVVSLVVFFLLVVSCFISKEILILSTELRSIWLPIHAGISLFSYGFLALAFCGGMMYLLLERELKKKRFGFLFERLPSLESLDQLNNHAITIGFLLYTVGLVTGLLWSKQLWGSYWLGSAKEIWSVIIWFIYLVQLHQRVTVGWRGRRAAWLAVASFIVVLFTVWGVTYFLGGAHSYAV